MNRNIKPLNLSESSDNVGLFGNTIIYGLGSFFSRSINFLLLPLYSNILNTNEFGIFSLIYSTYTILSFIYPVFLQAGFTKYFISENKSDIKKGIYTSTFLLTLSISLFLTIILSIFSKTFSFLIVGDSERYLLVTLLGWSLFVDTITIYFTNFLKTNQLAKRVIKYTSFAAIMNLILNIIFLYGFKLRSEGILLAQIISNAISGSILFYQQRTNLISKFDIESSKKILIFSIPLLASGLFGALMDVIDRFILNAFYDKSIVGIYSFSYRIAMVMNLLVMAFRAAWIPYSSEKIKNENYGDNFGFNFTKLIALTCFLFLVVSLFINDMFNFKVLGVNLFNKEYESGIVVIPIILIGYIFNGFFTFYSVYPFVSGKSFHILFADGIALILNIVLNLLFIPRWGILGAAFATSISFLINAYYLFFVSFNKIKVNYQPSKFIPIILQTLLFYFIGIYFNIIYYDIILIIIFSLTIKAILGLKFSSVFKLIDISFSLTKRNN